MNRSRNHRTLLAAGPSRRSPLPLLPSLAPKSVFPTLCFQSFAHSFAITWGWGVGAAPSLLFPSSSFVFRSSLSPLFATLTKIFHSPYPATPLFATLTKTAGVYVISSQNGTRLEKDLNFRSCSRRLPPRSLAIAQLLPPGSILWIAP